MFRYLMLLAAGFYLVLLIGGQDRGQMRMGLQGAYDVPLRPMAPPAATPADPPAQSAVTPPPPADTPRPAVTLRTVTAEAANIRVAALRGATVIGRLERGEIVQITGRQGDWLQVRAIRAGIAGFVHRRLISTEPPVMNPLMTPVLTPTTLFPARD